MKHELHRPIPAAAKYLVKGSRSIGYFLLVLGCEFLPEFGPLQFFAGGHP
jgi:hypothetical protein